MKTISFLKRNKNLSKDEFLSYWKGHHAALFCAPEIMRHIDHYAQNSIENTISSLDFVGQDYDGLLECTFKSLEDFEAVFSEPHYLEVVRPDEARFLDPEKSIMFVVQETMRSR